MHPGALPRIEIGPFWPRAAPLGIAALLGSAGSMLLFLHEPVVHVRCDVGAPLCEIEAGQWRASFARAEVREVLLREERRAHSKGKGYTLLGRVLLRVARGEVYVGLWPFARAQRAAEALKRFLAAPLAEPLALAPEEDPILRTFGAVMAVGALIAAGVGFSASGRARFELDRARGRLIGSQRILGLRVARVVHDAAGIADVQVEWGPMVRHRGGAVTPLRLPRGRLTLVRSDGERKPILRRFFPGFRQHLDAAAALREALACPRRSTETELRLWREEELVAERAARPAFAAWAAAWVGGCTGSLLGAAASALLAVLFGAKGNELHAPSFLAGATAGAILGGYALIRWTRGKSLPRRPPPT